VSRELLRGEERGKEEPVAEITRLVQTQQDLLLNLLHEHKQEVEHKLQTKSRRFGNRQIERQFEVNTGFRELAQKALAGLEAGEVIRAKQVLEELVKGLEEHEQDLQIADASPHGWLAVSKLRSTKELPKGIRKRLVEVDKLLSQQKDKDGGVKRKFQPVPGTSTEPLYRRPQQRVSPEEALFAAAKQLRPGTCSQCQKGLHFFRECPEFWKKVQASREAKAKESQPEEGGN
jgi:hypothetical protein